MTRAASTLCRFLPRFETLEDRTLMSTCHVTRLSDTGNGSGFRGDLRYCINKVNAEPGEDLIIFSVNGTIDLNSTLPDLTGDLIIAGPGADNITVRRAGTADYRIFTVPAGMTAQIYGLTIAGGRSGFGGGIRNNGTLTLADSVVTNNLNPDPPQFSKGIGGGGIYNNGTLSVYRSTISGNLARSEIGGNGGGVYNDLDGLAIFADSDVVNNTADGLSTVFSTGVGGGIYNAGNLSIVSSNISSNAAASIGDFYGYVNAEGGGIFNRGVLNVSNSTFTLNTAFAGGACPIGVSSSALGGAISNGKIATISNSTFVQNDATNLANCQGSQRSQGGAIYNRQTGTLAVRHCTIANNSVHGVGTAGGGVYAGGTIRLNNTVVATNLSEQNIVSSDISGVLKSSGYNLIGISGGATGYAPTDLLDVDPLLGPLADNGGLTQTMALLPGSPAIDAGDNTDAPEFDQRGPGFPRIVNGTIDIGAFEVQSTGAPAITRPARLPQAV